MKQSSIFNLMAKALFICAFGLLFAMEITAQNIIRPKIACPNNLWVNSYNGVLFFERTDLRTQNSAFPLQLQFYYNSSYAEKNYGYGAGFSLGYETRYTLDSLGIVIEAGDGRRDLYTRYGDVFVAPAGVFHTLTEYEQGKYLLQEKTGTKYYFDDAANKRVTKIEERNGNATSFTYQNDLLASISDFTGRTITLKWNNDKLLSSASASFTQGAYTYGYDAKKRLTKITDPMGYSMLYGYNDDNRLSVITDPNGNKTQITYNSNGAVNRVKTAVTDKAIRYERDANRTVFIDYTEPANQFSYFVWDNKGRVIEKNGNCCGRMEALEYDNDDNIIKRTDGNGHVRTYTYDNNGNMLTATDPEGKKEHYTYEPAFNQIASYTDKKGNVYNFTYDNKGNLTQLSGPLAYTNRFTYNEYGLPLTVTDANSNVTQSQYSEAGLLTAQTDAAGNTRRFGYDAAGNLTSTTDARGFTTTYTYNANRWLTKITDALQNKTEMSYDKAGNAVRILDAANRITANTYDALGNLLTVTDPAGKVLKYHYNGKGKLVQMVNQVGDSVTISYDANDRMTSITNAANETTSFDYDVKGNLIAVVQPNGNTVSYHYNANDLLSEMSDSEGLILKQTYDANGNLLTKEDAEGRIITQQYDVLNRLIRTTDPAGSSEVYTYDANSNRLSYANRNGNTEIYVYDALNQLTEVTDALSGKTKYQYDGEGNLISATDAKNNATAYTYDALGRNTHITFANGTTAQYWYDALGNVTQMKDRNGNQIKYSYDALNQLITRLYPDGKTDRFAYDEIGQLVSAINENATLAFAYDKAGRITKETLNGKNTAYTYNTAARKRTVTYPGGKSVEEAVNFRDQLTQVSEDDAVVAGMTYNAGGQMLSRTYGNGTATQFAYNANGWLSRINDGATINDLSFVYDKTGNITLRTDGRKAQNSEKYVYDALQRLTQFSRGTVTGGNIPAPVRNIVWQYDALGNRISATENSVITNYAVNAQNEYTSIAGGLAFTPQYDANGNLKNDKLHTYQYDYNNQLVKVDDNTASYQYDVFGRRIGKTTAEGALYFYYDGDHIIEERNAADAVIATYIFGSTIDDILKMNRNNTGYYYHKDQLGSVVALTGTEGQVVERYQYDPFGAVTFLDASDNGLTQSAVGNRILFTGREYDAETETYYYRARTMHPQIGRFMQADPLLYVDGMNYYSYAINNPIFHTDPRGTACPFLDQIQILSNSLNTVNDFIQKINSFLEKIPNEFKSTYSGKYKFLEGNNSGRGYKKTAFSKVINRIQKVWKRYEHIVDGVDAVNNLLEGAKNLCASWKECENNDVLKKLLMEMLKEAGGKIKDLIWDATGIYGEVFSIGWDIGSLIEEKWHIGETALDFYGITDFVSNTAGKYYDWKYGN
jgi:RHS repeat-associated protein